MKRIIALLFLIGVVLISGCSNTARIEELEVQLAQKDMELIKLENYVKYYTEATATTTTASFNFEQGDYYYDLASLAYSNQEYAWQDVIDSCVIARDFYGTAAQQYIDGKALYEKAKESSGDIVLDYYIGASETGSKMGWAMYEACEYFESAATYYSQGIYDTGDSEIRDMNKKIKEHDRQVLIFNEFLSKIEAEEL